MKRIALSGLLVLALAAGGAFYYFQGKEYEFRLSDQEILEKLSASLPLTKTYLLVFDVTLDAPRVVLTEGSGRVGAGIDFTLNVRLGDEPDPLRDRSTPPAGSVMPPSPVSSI